MVWNLYQIGQNIEWSSTKNINYVFKKIFECMCDKIPLISRLPENEGQTFEGGEKKEKKKPPLRVMHEYAALREKLCFDFCLNYAISWQEKKNFQRHLAEFRCIMNEWNEWMAF